MRFGSRPWRAGGPGGRSTGVLAGTAMSLSGCTGAPALNVVGSYFPAWMLCTLIGIVVAVGIRQLLVVLDLDSGLVVPLLTHALVALAATLGVWLVWFGH